MVSGENSRAAFTIASFVLGLSAAGFAISSAIVSLLVILGEVAVAGPGGPSLSSQIALILCIGILILGVFLVRGSLMIWRLSVMGGGINLASGIILAILSFAMFSVASSSVQSVYNLLLVEHVLMGLMAMISGTFGIVALFEQVQRRFTSSRGAKKRVINISVAFPDGNITQIDLRNDDTLRKLKNKVHRLEGKSVDDKVIIYRGKKITDESMTLGELGIKEGDRITLI